LTTAQTTAIATPEIQKLVTGWMGPFYEGKEQLQWDEAMRMSSWAFMGKATSIIRRAGRYVSGPRVT